MPKNESSKPTSATSLTDTETKPTAAIAAAVPVVKKVKPHYVRVENRMRQVLRISVINDDGQAVEIKIPALQFSHAVREDRITEHTRNLVSQGRARLA